MLNHEAYYLSYYIDGLVQGCSNPIAKAMGFLQSCTKPYILIYICVFMFASDDWSCHFLFHSPRPVPTIWTTGWQWWLCVQQDIQCIWFSSVTPEKCGCNLKCIFLKDILARYLLSISSEITLRWTTQDHIDKSRLVVCPETNITLYNILVVFVGLVRLPVIKVNWYKRLK